MTDTEKAIQELRELLKKFFDTADVDTLVTIRQAIQALQKKAKRDKGCEYCNDFAAEGACDSDGEMRIEKGNIHCLPYIAVNNDTYGTSDLFDINYCPMCGRKLNNSPTDEL